MTFGTIEFRNLQNGNTLKWGGCSGSFTVNEQVSEFFIGRLEMQGTGLNSDRFCTASGTFSGDLEPGGGARAHLEGDFQNWPRPSTSPSCDVMSAGDGMWTGTATGDSIQLQVRDTLRCPADVDGGTRGLPMVEFERSVTLIFQPWSVTPR